MPIPPRVIWTPGQKRKLHPRRGSPRLSKSLRPQRRISRAAFRATHRAARDTLRRADSRPEFKELLEAMLAQWDDPSRADEPLDVRHEAMAFGTLMIIPPSAKLLKPLVRDWLAAESPAFAIRALAQSVRMSCWYWGGEPKPQSTPRLTRQLTQTLRLLRRELACCEQARWDEALAAAQALRGEAPLYLRCLLSYLFPSESAWGDADVDAVLRRHEEAPELGIVELAPTLLASGASLEKLELLSRQDILRLCFGDEDSFAVSLVDRVGAAADQVLANLHDIGTWYNPKQRPHTIRLLSMVESPITLGACAERLDRWETLCEPDVAFLRGAPDFAIPALEAAIRSGGERPRAAALLAELRGS